MSSRSSSPRCPTVKTSSLGRIKHLFLRRVERVHRGRARSKGAAEVLCNLVLVLRKKERGGKQCACANRNSAPLSRRRRAARNARFCRRAKPVLRPSASRKLNQGPGDGFLRGVNLREGPCTHPCNGAHAHPSPGRLQPCFVQRDRDKRGIRIRQGRNFAPARGRVVA